MSIQKMFFIVVSILFLSLEINAKDLYLTTQVENTKFYKEQDGITIKLSRIYEGFKLKNVVDKNKGDKLVVDSEKVTKKPCSFGDEFFGFCGNLKFEDDVSGFVKDIAALPIIKDASILKIAILRYNMHLGGNIYIPFSILSSEVAGSTDQEKINSLKLLDPEQGKLNVKWSYAGRYHIGDFGKYDNNSRGLCAIGINLGARYLGLEETEKENEKKTKNKDAYGGYIELSNSWIFPIYDINKESKDAGLFAIKISGVYYYQNIAGDTILFPDAVDSDGIPLEFKKEFFGYNAIANLNITDKLSIKVSYFKVKSHEQLDNETTFEISYDF
jgi:hypothetical protein